MGSILKGCILLFAVGLMLSPVCWSFQSSQTPTSSKPTTSAQSTKLDSTSKNIASGKTRASSTYASQTEGDLFRGGRWCGSRNGQDWVQRDFPGPLEIAEIGIGRAGTDVSTDGSSIVIKLLQDNGKWMVVDELKNTNINWTDLSFGNKGRSVPPYHKILQPPVRATAFRLELSGHGWFVASDIQLKAREQTKKDDVISSAGSDQPPKSKPEKKQVRSGKTDNQDVQPGLKGGKDPSVIPGDLNGKGVHDAADALEALKMSIGLIPPKSMYDTDGDVEVSSTDARQILQKVVEK